jgi:hypothetical protein
VKRVRKMVFRRKTEAMLEVVDGRKEEEVQMSNL